MTSPPIYCGHSLALTSGTRLGPYEILAPLGAGGMGEVYTARDTRLDRTVAIKVLPANVADDQQFRDRFEREAKTIAALTHPHICTLHDVGVTGNDHPFLVMELLQGETLQLRLARGPLDASLVVDLGIALAAGLEAAHRVRIVHRDIKPANIFLTVHGPKILDFGLAKAAPLVDAAASMQSTQAQGPMVTEPGGVLGTVMYMSPEQLRGEPLDERTDVFSLGLVLYEMATGRRAFTGATSAVISAAILHTPPLTPRVVRPDLPVGLEDVILKAIEKDRELRYQHASGIRVDLQRLKAATDQRVTPVAPLPPASRKLNRLVKPGIAAVAALVVAVAGFFFSSQQRPAAKPLTERDVLVLADFTNTTGDPVFDDTLRQALAIQLEQSPFLKIMDDEQVQRDLRLMNLPRGVRITNPMAHEICVRDAAAATIGGSIASLGKRYVITLQAITCEGGETLAREQIQADDKEHVLNAVETAATAMRTKLGESRSSIQRSNRPLEQATTGSLEALQSYTAGYAELSQGRFLAAVPLFERALALDPNFAMAYQRLSTAFNNAGDTRLEAEYKRKAFSLIDRVSEHERHGIAAGYYQSTGELDKAIDALRVAVGSYPRIWGFHNNLSENYIALGQFEEGLNQGHAANQLQPNAEPPYRRLLDAYMCLDRLDEAKKVAEQVRTLGIGGGRIHQRFLEMAYIEGDASAVARETQWFSGKPEEYISLGLQAANRNVLGQRIESGQVVPASRGECVATGAPGRCRGLRRSECARRRAVGELRHRASPGASRTGAGHVRRCGSSGEGGSGDISAFSEWNHLECGAATRDSRGDRTPARSACQGGRTPGHRLALRACVPRGRVPARAGIPASAQRRRGGRGVSKDPRSRRRQLGQHMALSELGPVLFDFVRWPRARVRDRGRHGESAESLPRLLRTVEGRRRGPAIPHRCEERLRRATLENHQE